MTKDHLSVTQVIAATPDQVWSVVRDFCSPWHPFIAEMKAEHDNHGHLVRAFRVMGEGHYYRERLVWFSDSDRCMIYVHVEGIAGVEHYQGYLQINEQDNQALMTMSAWWIASDERSNEIREGTLQIFEQGIARVQDLVRQSLPESMTRSDSVIDHPSGTLIDGAPILAVSRLGQKSSTVCVFLHGIGGNRSNWDDQLPVVSPHCEVVAMDLRGYGDSQLGHQPTTIDDYCNDILRVVDYCKADNLILCGLSLGAWIATSFAMRFPERLKGLVLAGGCLGMTEASDDERRGFRESRATPLAQGQTPADFADNVVELICGPQADDAVRKALRTSMAAIQSDTYADALQCFTNPGERFDFSCLTVPTLMVTGEHDRLASPEEIRSVAQRILEHSTRPDVRFECLGGTGHVCNLESPDQFNRVLAEFVERLLPLRV